MEENFKVYRARLPMAIDEEIKRLAFYDNCTETEALEYFIHLGIKIVERIGLDSVVLRRRQNLSKNAKNVNVPKRKEEVIGYLLGMKNANYTTVFSYIIEKGIEYAKEQHYKFY